MSRFPSLLAAFFCILSTPVLADGYGLGRPALPEEIAAWDLDVSPDATGLPSGSGSVEKGEMLFSDNCAACHGEFAEGVGNWPKLAGGDGTLDRKDPVKTVGSYWPYLSTVWDYVHRSMPFGAAQTLSPDEVYALTAYILYSNYIVEEDFVLSDRNFGDIEMPNAGGFIIDDRDKAEAHFWAEPCMTGCKDEVRITRHASVLDVTPDTAEDETPAAASSRDTTESAPGDMAAAVSAASEPDPALVAAGEKLFRKCKACHQVGEGARNRVGPQLNGVLGRRAGGLDGFRYSTPMTEHGADGLIWSDATLAAFLRDPKGYIKGTKMSFAGLKKDKDIAAITAYLASLGG